MNGTSQPRNNTPLIVYCVTLMGLTSIGCGTWLISKGYMAGELLLSSGGVAAISGLLGMAVNRPAQPNPLGDGDTTTTQTTQTVTKPKTDPLSTDALIAAEQKPKETI